MTHILTESAHWLFSAIVLGPACFSLSCLIGSIWTLENWRLRP